MTQSAIAKETNSATSLGESFQGRRVMVTGGLGFIGSNVAKRLVDLGANVLVVDSMQPNTGCNYANLRGYEDRLTVHQFDLRSCDESPDLFAGCEFIFNLAGSVSHLDSMTNPIGDLGANVHAQIVLLDACRRYAPDARVIFASTRQIYGRPVRVPVDESHPLQPVDVNGINKMAAEAYHTLYHQVYGLRTVSLRLTNTFGPGMRVKDARLTFLGIWLRRIVEGDTFEVWGGHQQRDLTYVDDVVDAFLLAAITPTAQGRIFNIGGCSPVTLLELANLLVAAGGGGRYEIKEFPPERLRIDIGDYFADDRQFREVTGWTPRTTLQDGLVRTLAHYRLFLEDYV